MNDENKNKVPASGPESDHAVMDNVRTISWKAVLWALAGAVATCGTWAVWVTVSLWIGFGRCDVVNQRLSHLELEGDNNTTTLSRVQQDLAGRPSISELRTIVRQVNILDEYRAQDKEDIRELKASCDGLRMMLDQLYPYQRQSKLPQVRHD